MVGTEEEMKTHGACFIRTKTYCESQEQQAYTKKETSAQLRDEDHTKKEREHIEKIDVQR